MADHETADQLRAMAQQAGCLAEYFRRGDVDSARWLLQELKHQLSKIVTDET